MLRQDSTKRYNQLAVDLLKKILNRHYLPGSKLPSTRELAKQAGVNPNTMQKQPYRCRAGCADAESSSGKKLKSFRMRKYS